MIILYQAAIVIAGGIIGMKVSAHVVPAFLSGLVTAWVMGIVGRRW